MNRSPNWCENVFKAPEHPPRRSIMEPRPSPCPSRSRLKNNTTLPCTHPSHRPSLPRALRHPPRKRPLRRRPMAPPSPRPKNPAASRRRCVRLCPAVPARPSTLPCEPAQSPRGPYRLRRVLARFSPDRASPCLRRRRLRRIRHRGRWLRNRSRAPLRRRPNRLQRQRPDQLLEHRRRRCPFDLRPRVRIWPASRPLVPSCPRVPIW